MIYILQFDPPLHHARFYVGYCDDTRLDQRLIEHQTGNGAAITRAAVERGISLRLVATLPGQRDTERQIKRQKNTPRLVRQLQQQNQNDAYVG